MNCIFAEMNREWLRMVHFLESLGLRPEDAALHGPEIIEALIAEKGGF